MFDEVWNKSAFECLSRYTPSIALRGVWAHCTVGDAFTEHGVIGKIFVAIKYLVTPSVFKQ